ncbi:hypothetical protein BV210_18975 (plasmid) [Halorientalis sp. IM1011]|uniref:hypothetical protein n=1 Tax=Halorientalis sp. IM1011 TaxID=1932360 RepID=UPI00097CC3EF|nr:hypothetical protein [Halorientalis sp. IM1011]AQL44849.1 hypothetical protein BV210_18975 [Halorientalis sp. IM1011]
MPTDTPTPMYERLTPETTVETAGGQITRGWIVAIHTSTIERPLEDYRVVLTPTQDGSRFTVFRAAETVRIPDGSCLRPSLDAITIRERGYQYDILKTELVPPEDLANGSADDLLRLPDDFQDSLVLESPPTNPDLWESLTHAESLATERSHDGMPVEDSSESDLQRYPLS